MIKLSDPMYNWLNKVLPVKLINSINRYSNKPQNVGNSNEWLQFLRSHLLNTIMQMVIIVAIIILSVKYLLPYIQNTLDGNPAAKIVVVIITFLMIAPFLWALAIKQPKKRNSETDMDTNPLKAGTHCFSKSQVRTRHFCNWLFIEQILYYQNRDHCGSINTCGAHCCLTKSAGILFAD